MKRVIWFVVLLLMTGCATRNETFMGKNKVSFVLQADDFRIESSTTESADGSLTKSESSKENGSDASESSDGGVVTANGGQTRNPSASKDIIDDVVFYLFDEKGVMQSKTLFSSVEGCSLEITSNGRYNVYVLCNLSGIIDLPNTVTMTELEAMTIPHKESYDKLPFSGKTTIDVVSGAAPTIHIKLNRLNSGIKFENVSPSDIKIDKIVVSGLPDRGTLFGGAVEAEDVSYSATAEAVADADGNFYVYGFYVPEAHLSSLSAEAYATVINGDVNADGNDKAETSSSLNFAEPLIPGEMATGLVGYLSSGSLKVGSSDNWGNVGSLTLSGNTKIQVVGGSFNDSGELRAYSGGSEFSFIIKTNKGVGELVNSQSVDWIEIRDNVIIVDANKSDKQRSAQIAVKVGGDNIGVFTIVQGRGITFSGSGGTTIEDGCIRIIGGVGSINNSRTVTYEADDAEMEDIVITPTGNASDNKSGIVIEVNRETKSITAKFIETIDASSVSEEGIEATVSFVDPNGGENAKIIFAQRPARIVFSPARLSNVSFNECDGEAIVTTENDASWSVYGPITETGGSTASWVTKTTPATNGVSGGKFVLHFAANSGGAGREALLKVISSNTISKPFEIMQLPSYGIKSISATEAWDASATMLRSYSKGRSYDFTFVLQNPAPAGSVFVVDCKSGTAAESGITASGVTQLEGSADSYSFTLTVPDSKNEELEEEYEINITTNGVSIGSFIVKKALKPRFVQTAPEEVWGGVKNRPELKTAVFSASDWDIEKFSTDNEKIGVSRSGKYGEILVGYAETMKYDDESQSATVTMTLKGGNSLSFPTKQSPVVFTVTDTTLLKSIGKGGDNIPLTVKTTAGENTSQWHVAKSTQTWLTTTPAVGGAETNPSGSTLTVNVAATTTGDRTGQFVLESQNTTSQSFTVMQLGTFSANITKAVYGSAGAAVLENNTLKAFSTAYDYTLTITTNNKVTGNRVKVVSKTSGTAVSIKSQPSGTSLTNTVTCVLTVPANSTTDEITSDFDITVDGNVSGSFSVIQAKKTSILVGGKASYPVIGGLASANGTFVASVWDIPDNGYVTSSNATAHAVGSLSTAGTFSVAFKPTLLYNSPNTSANIVLKGRDGVDRATATVSQTPVKFTFAPTSYAFDYQSGLSTTVTVTTTNAGTIASGMTASTPSGGWAATSVSANKVTVSTTAANATGAARNSSFTVTYKGTTSQAFAISQNYQYTGTLSCTTSGAVFASNKLSAFSVAKSYTIRLTLNRAAAANTVTATRTSGTLTLTNPSGTASSTTHDFTISVPASTTTTEPISTFDIKVGSLKVATLTVQQAKKASILVNNSAAYSVVGGLASANGTFVASTWDIATSNYVTSSNATAHAVSSLATTGTFKVAFKSTLAYNTAATNATIALKGRDGANRATATVSQTPVKFTFSPTSYAFGGTANLSTVVTVTTTNAGTIASGMTATTPSGNWATTTVSANKVTVKTTAANTTGATRSSSFTVTYKGTTSQAFAISQKHNYTGTLSCTTSGAVFASNKLSAFSVAKSYAIRLTLNKAAAGSLVTVTRTSGTLTLTKTSGTGSSTTHDFSVSVPASTATTEPTSTFDIKVDGQKVATLTVQQAKKASILVGGKGSYAVIGGLASANGTFVASTWDIATANYVTSSNTTAHAVSSLATTGTFKVAFKSTLAYNTTATSATITLKGRDGANRATATVSQTPVKFTFSPTSYTFEGDANLSTVVTVTSTNAGTISSGMTATTPSGGWASTTVAANKVTVKTISKNTLAQRNTTFTVTYKGTTSQTFSIIQKSLFKIEKWSDYNVGEYRKFVAKKPSQLTGIRLGAQGNVYQFNRTKPWPTTGSVTGWTSVINENSDWVTTKDPCPTGYRLPTYEEFVMLYNNTTQSNGGGWTIYDYGYKIFKSGNVTKEFIAAGRRHPNASLSGTGNWGGYWSSQQANTTIGYYMNFSSTNIWPFSSNDKSFGFHIRCVLND